MDEKHQITREIRSENSKKKNLSKFTFIESGRTLGYYIKKKQKQRRV